MTTAISAQESQRIPSPITPYVSDFANLIDPETEARITADLTKLRQELDLELTVVTVETRFDYGEWPSIEGFSTALFNDWGIGDDTRNDGVMILVSRSDREMRIELGESYGPIYDDRMKLVIDHHFIPYFRGEEYASGIEAGTIETIKRLQPNYDILTPDELERPTFWRRVKNSDPYHWIVNNIGLLAFLGLFAFVTFENILRRTLVGLRKCPNCRQRELTLERETIHPRTETDQGQDEIISYCSNCGFEGRETRVLPSYAQARAGRSSGFGGGRSSGGGASGSW